MKDFIDLLRSANAGEIDGLFERMVARSPFRLWKPGDPIAEQGTRLLIGVAPWSGYDMMLLDVLTENRNSSRPLVELFNTADCVDQKAFSSYIPDIGPVLQTPVAGLWLDGQLQWCDQGHAAREHVASLFGTSAAAVVQRVDEWMKTRLLKSTA